MQKPAAVIPATPRPSAAKATPRPALASLALCMLLPSLGTSIANVALPTLAQEFGAPFQSVQWVVLAYLLATTALVVGAGRMGDLLGRRRLLLAGVALFTLASMLCAMASDLWWLVAARALQGVGAALLMALATALAAEAVPKDQTGSAMGLLGTMSAVGTALGPSLGGLLITGPGWRAIFALLAPLGLLAGMLAARSLPADRPAADSPSAARFDTAGTLLLALTLLAYALAMTLGRGHPGMVNAALLAAAVLGLLLFLRTEARAPAPLVHPGLLTNASLRSGLAATTLVATVMMTTLVVGPFYLSLGLGLAPATVGLVMSIGPVVSALMGVPSGRLVDRFGARRATLAGLGLMLLGCLLLALAPMALGVAGYALPLATLTAGYALFQAANNTAVMAGAASAQRGLVSGLLNLGRNLGLVTGASAMGAVFAWAAATADLASAPAQALSLGLRASFGLAAMLVAAALAVTARSAAR